jgi:hypothetical protein
VGRCGMEGARREAGIVHRRERRVSLASILSTLQATQTIIPSTNMAVFKALLIATALCSELTSGAAFTSGAAAFVSQKPTHQSVPITRSRLPTPITDHPSQLFSFSSSDTQDEPINKRRAFLATFASASILPLLPTPSFARGVTNENGPLVYGDDSIMSPKEHGTTAAEVQDNLRYGVSRKLADKISSFNRVFAEMGGYFEGTNFEDEVRRVVKETGGPVTFYDSVSGKPLFRAPIGRSVDAFMTESAVVSNCRSVL